MELTKEVLRDLGFRKSGSKYISPRGVVIFENNMPETLRRLVDVLTGTAFNEGKREGRCSM